MITKTRDRIVLYLKQHRETTAHELRNFLGIGGPALFRQLKKLQNEGVITKIGKPPKVFYFLKQAVPSESTTVLKPIVRRILNENFFFITPLGEMKEGVDGFIYWCTKHTLPVAKTAEEYQRTLTKYDAHKKDGLINGLPKLKKTFPEVYLDELYYLDFYSIERFGKTKLGSLLLYAKQSQSTVLMQQLFALTIPKIQYLIEREDIEAVGFVPPTVQRTVQFQKELEKNLNLNVPRLTITKATGMIPVPQKTLNKLPDRVENAGSTIFIEYVPDVKRILLIDDAVGSGASLNETARKIKEKFPKVQVVGVAVTGSFKGFDVLNEV